MANQKYRVAIYGSDLPPVGKLDSKLYVWLAGTRHFIVLFTILNHLTPTPVRAPGSRIVPLYPYACRKRRLKEGSLFAVGCNPWRWRWGSWWLWRAVAAASEEHTTLASDSPRREVQIGPVWINQQVIHPLWAIWYTFY